MASEIIYLKTTAALVDAAADAWTRWIRAGHPTDGYRSVALGGGRVFRSFLSASAARLQTQRDGLERLDFFWGDERCVPPGDGESNYRLGRESFLAPLGVRPERIHRLRGEADPAEAAVAAEIILRTATGCPKPQMPVLDLIFLGLGEDAHVASLFPDAPDDVTRATEVYLPVIGPKPPPQRLTLTYAMIAAAREVWVIASGAGKETALRESLQPVSTTPLGRVLRDRPFTRIYTDLQLPS